MSECGGSGKLEHPSLAMAGHPCEEQLASWICYPEWSRASWCVAVSSWGREISISRNDPCPQRGVLSCPINERPICLVLAFSFILFYVF